MLCCLFRAWRDLAIALCLPDKSANHYIRGQILKLPLEILLSEFLISLDFCTEGYFTKFCLIEKIILFRLICLCFHTTLGTTIMRMVRPNLRSKHKQITEKPKWLLQRISCNFPASKNETKFNWNLLLCLFILTPPASSLTYLFWFAFLYFNWSSLLIHFTRQKNKLGKWENFCP